MKYIKYALLILLLISTSIPSIIVLDRTASEPEKVNEVYTLRSRIYKTPYKVEDSFAPERIKRPELKISNPIMIDVLAHP
jgi:hypothetical protein